jgi:CBS domain-containing protein
MSRQVIAIEESSSIAKVHAAMDEYRFRHLPVIDELGKVVGLLSQRDLLRAEPSTLSPDHDAEDEVFKATTKVDSIMLRDVITIGPDDPLADAARVLLERNIGSLPVVRSNGSLVGIVTRTDFLRLALGFLEGAQT